MKFEVGQVFKARYGIAKCVIIGFTNVMSNNVPKIEIVPLVKNKQTKDKYFWDQSRFAQNWIYLYSGSLQAILTLYGGKDDI